MSKKLTEFDKRMQNYKYTSDQSQDVSSSDVSFYTITIKDANTGKVTETLTTTGTIYIDISNFLSAEYDIEIDMESMLLYGSFTIQDN